MKFGFIGLGKMGIEMAGRAVNYGHEVVGFDVNSKALIDAENNGIEAAESIDDLLERLPGHRVIWMQLPPGSVTSNMISCLEKKLTAGDLIIDGGNSDFRDSVETGKRLEKRGIRFVDIGVSGGVQGARNGAGMLVGASTEEYAELQPIFEALCAPKAYSLCGGLGAGHYAKAVHNGVEYALMQAYAEGYELLRDSNIDVDVLATVTAYQNGCSIRSYILEEILKTLTNDVNLSDVEGFVADSGMGLWTIEEATRLRIPTPTISAALQARFRSQQEDSPAMQCLAALRGTIGGHPVKRKGMSHV